MNAVFNRNKLIIDMFFEAEPLLDPALASETGFTPLYAAAEGGYADIFVFLRQK
jgi:hypothetical protein